MLAAFAILPLLEQYSINQNGNQLYIYGDLAYPLRPQLQTPFSKPQLNTQQPACNTTMSKARVVVEWVFGDIANFLKFLDYKKVTYWQNLHSLCFFNEHSFLYVWLYDF